MRNFGLIGRKLSHSYSKDYFDRKFRTENISDSTYSLFEIDKIDELPLLLRKFPDLAGFNVTFPFKQSVIPFLDNISDDAKEIGAVNTVLVEKSCGRRYLTGYNTDYIGFLETLENQCFNNAIVLGTGGASAAVRYALRIKNCNVLTVSRDIRRGLLYSQLTNEIVASSDLIVNCTPLGTFPNVDDMPPFPYKYLTDKCLLYDLVYNPTETRFLMEGKKRGTKIKNGLEMLYNQAESAWKIWNK